MLSRRRLLGSLVGLPLLSLFRKKRTMGIDPAEGSDSTFYAIWEPFVDWDWKEAIKTNAGGCVTPLEDRHYFCGGCRVFLDGVDVSDMKMFRARTGSRGFIQFYRVDGGGFVIDRDSNLSEEILVGFVEVVEGKVE